MTTVIALLVILLIAVIAFYIVKILPLDATIKQVVTIIIGVIILIALLYQLLPLIGVHVPGGLSCP